MGLVKIAASDPVRNVLVNITTIELDDGTPLNPVAAALPVAVAFVLTGGSPDGATWLPADWVAVIDGTYRVRCQVGSAATGTLPLGQYQVYVQAQTGGETITVPAADILEAY